MCFFGESDFPQQRAISWENRQLRSIIQQLGDSLSIWKEDLDSSTKHPLIHLVHTAYVGKSQSTSLTRIITSTETPLLVTPHHKLCTIFIYCHIFFTLEITKKNLPPFSHPMNPCITSEKTQICMSIWTENWWYIWGMEQYVGHAIFSMECIDMFWLLETGLS